MYQSNRNIECTHTGTIGPSLTEKEKCSLLESIVLLNEGLRVQVIVDNIENYLNDDNVLYGLCEICHNLMIYNKMAMFEYKYEQNKLYIQNHITEFSLLQTVIHPIFYAKFYKSCLV